MRFDKKMKGKSAAVKMKIVFVALAFYWALPGLCIGLDCDVVGKCINSDILGTTLTNDAKACLSYCFDNPSCKWYSYLSQQQICVALENCRNLDTSCSTCLSGQRECLSNCTQIDGCCQGTTIDYSGAQDANECQEKCSVNENCNWFTFRSDDKICILLTDCPSVTNQNEGVCTSGDKNCNSDEDDCDDDNQQDGCCQGNALQYATASTVEECANECKKYEGCLWYSFTLENKFCLLLSSCPTLNNPNEGVCISGNINCTDTSDSQGYILIGFGSLDAMGNNASNSVELYDLRSGTKCSKTSSPVGSYGIIGEMISHDQAIFCGSFTNSDGCRILKSDNTWTSGPSMHISRRFAGFSTFKEGVLVTGGLNNAEIGAIENTMEVFAADNKWKLLNSKLPDNIYGHCQLSLNSSLLMIIGGYGASSGYSSKTWFVEIDLSKETVSFTEGPRLSEARFNHACAFDEQAGVVIVAGGYDDTAVPKNTEILDLKAAKPSWTKGPDLPEGTLHGAELIYQPDFGTTLIGGILIEAQSTSKSMWKYSQDKWSKIDSLELTVGKGNFVGFKISRNFLSC